VWIPASAIVISTLLSLWLPYRVAVVRAFFWMGGSRLLVRLEYKAMGPGEYVPVSTAPGYPSRVEVLALHHGGEARAVPLPRLAWHMVMNERLGDEPVLLTLCNGTDTALAFRSRCQGRELTFEPAVMGRNNLVLRDRETKSEWQQFTGQAISGPLQGCQLEPVSAPRLTLGEFARRFPEGQVLKPLGNRRDTQVPNGDCTVMCYFDSDPFLLQRPSHEDARLPRKQRVWAWQKDGRPTACARPSGGIPSRPVIDTYWFSWVEFHPDTELTSTCDENLERISP
jgi:hypothetical protein